MFPIYIKAKPLHYQIQREKGKGKINQNHSTPSVIIHSDVITLSTWNYYGFDWQLLKKYQSWKAERTNNQIA